MSVHLVDPVRDPRWPVLLARHPRATLFHTPEWLAALQQTYGYAPTLLTTSPPGEPLADGLPLCDIRTWLGRRAVSLPFSDHCDLLERSPAAADEIAAYLCAAAGDARWKYVELRPRADAPAPPRSAPFAPASSYILHTVDLTPPSAAIFRRFHPSCIQRSIRRAQREALTYDVGGSAELVRRFHHLLVMTRRRHGLPPQPLAWFLNLAAGLRDRFAIHMASRDGQPIAALLILRFKQVAMFKYGVSDARHHARGAVPWLFWRVMQESREAGIEQLDLGRTDPGQDGLAVFKDRLGGMRTHLTYYRFPGASTPLARTRLAHPMVQRLVMRLPDAALAAAGRLLYRHLG